MIDFFNVGFEIQKIDTSETIHGHGCRTLEEGIEYAAKYGAEVVVTDQARVDELTVFNAPRLARKKALRQWPADNQTASFEDIADPIIAAIRFAYSLRRRNKDKDIPYKGFDTESSNHVTSSLADRFTAENLDWRLEDQGNDALHEIVCAAIQLGIEQGQRIVKSEKSKEIKNILLRARLASNPKPDDDSLIKFILD